MPCPYSGKDQAYPVKLCDLVDQSGGFKSLLQAQKKGAPKDAFVNAAAPAYQKIT